MEDVRFVRFTGGDGTVSYRATYTAYDGQHIAPQLIETRDFLRFTVSTLSGPAASNKGLALFPRTVRGRHVALTRSNGESNGIASSADGHRWSSPTLLAGGGRPWQLVQSGNCGSPVETAAGWLVLTHGVGPVREYAIGALLLDLEDPTRVLGELREPLLRAAADEREGYVPNVLYSCGSLLAGDRLLLPYGASDESVRFAVVDVPLLLGQLAADGPPATGPPAHRPTGPPAHELTGHHPGEQRCVVRHRPARRDPGPEAYAGATVAGAAWSGGPQGCASAADTGGPHPDGRRRAAGRHPPRRT